MLSSSAASSGPVTVHMDTDLDATEFREEEDQDEPASPTPLDNLLEQTETLRQLRSTAVQQSMALVDVLREELANNVERERSTNLKLRAAEKREAAALAESEQLRASLAREKADAAAAARRSSWEIRKRDEAVAIAAATASAAAAEAEEKASAAHAKLAAQLKQRERELQTMQAQLRAAQHQLKEQALRERQAAWLLQDHSSSQDSGASHPTVLTNRNRAAVAAKATVASKGVVEKDAPVPVPAAHGQTVDLTEDIGMLQEGFLSKLGV